jgi:hypothetical protein
MASSAIPNPSKKQIFIVVFAVVLSWSMQFVSNTIKFLVEVIIVAYIPLILRIVDIGIYDARKIIKKCWYFGIVGFALNILFQCMSLITRNIGIKFTDESSLVTLILMVDYYIMLVLYYLYVKTKSSKEVKNCG